MTNLINLVNLFTKKYINKIQPDVLDFFYCYVTTFGLVAMFDFVSSSLNSVYIIICTHVTVMWVGVQ